jgi:hypothetical protein
LDGGDDVAERPGAAALDRGQQRRVAADGDAIRAVAAQPVVLADAEVALAEQLVLESQQARPLDGEVTPAHEAHRVAAGRPVERLGDGRPPIDHDGLALLVGHGQAPDVEALHSICGTFAKAVDAAEHE